MLRIELDKPQGYEYGDEINGNIVLQVKHPTKIKTFVVQFRQIVHNTKRNSSEWDDIETYHCNEREITLVPFEEVGFVAAEQEHLIPFTMLIDPDTSLPSVFMSHSTGTATLVATVKTELEVHCSHPFIKPVTKKVRVFPCKVPGLPIKIGNEVPIYRLSSCLLCGDQTETMESCSFKITGASTTFQRGIPATIHYVVDNRSSSLSVSGIEYWVMYDYRIRAYGDHTFKDAYGWYSVQNIDLKVPIPPAKRGTGEFEVILQSNASNIEWTHHAIGVKLSMVVRLRMSSRRHVTAGLVVPIDLIGVPEKRKPPEEINVAQIVSIPAGSENEEPIGNCRVHTKGKPLSVYQSLLLAMPDW